MTDDLATLVAALWCMLAVGMCLAGLFGGDGDRGD